MSKNDCSNCVHSVQVAPYKVCLRCNIDQKLKMLPHTCDDWESVFLNIPVGVERNKKEVEMASLKEMRRECGSWDKEMGCLDDYPEDCPIHEQCKREAKDLDLSDEEKVPA